jgi:hypothetical protein
MVGSKHNGQGYKKGPPNSPDSCRESCCTLPDDQNVVLVGLASHLEISVLQTFAGSPVPFEATLYSQHHAAMSLVTSP